MVPIIVFLSVTLVALAVVFFFPARTPAIKDHLGNPLPSGISSLEKVRLGGTDQWILVRGHNVTNPVILFLHGGPGTSDMCMLRRHLSGLEKHFIVISWDQRGAGKSFSAIHPESSMKIEQFLSDVYELTGMLCKRFNQEKIFLAGHSWGTVLGVLSVRDHPDLYHAYIGIGQIASMQENELLSYDWTLEQAKKADDTQIVNKLIEIGKPPYSGDWQKKFITERRYLGKYGGEFHGSSKGAFPAVIGSLIRGSEYTLRDKVNFFRGIFSTVRLVWPELMTVDLRKIAPVLQIPIYFILGKHDHEAPAVLAEEYFNMLDAPLKELIWFENSAHLPNIEESEKFTTLLTGHILSSVQGR